MRFLVDAYRYLILVFLALALTGASYGILTLFLRGEEAAPIAGVALVGAVSAIVFVVLSIGLIATFISIHDRLADIAFHMRSLAERREPIESFRHDKTEQ